MALLLSDWVVLLMDRIEHLDYVEIIHLLHEHRSTWSTQPDLCRVIRRAMGPDPPLNIPDISDIVQTCDRVLAGE